MRCDEEVDLSSSYEGVVIHGLTHLLLGVRSPPELDEDKGRRWVKQLRSFFLDHPTIRKLDIGYNTEPTLDWFPWFLEALSSDKEEVVLPALDAIRCHRLDFTDARKERMLVFCKARHAAKLPVPIPTSNNWDGHKDETVRQLLQTSWAMEDARKAASAGE